MKTYTLFIFRRDLRIKDNKGLDYCIKNFKNTIPVFIFTPEQVTNKNKFKSDNAIQFMIESLKELDKELKKYKSRLHTFYGDNVKVLKKIMTQIKVENVVYNEDYTPYAIKRDKAIKKLCQKKKVNVHTEEDYLLKPMGTMLKGDGDPYTVFTPFKNNGMKETIDKPSSVKIKNLTKSSKIGNYGYIKHDINKNILVKGGRKSGLKMLGKLKKQKKYNRDRNTLSIPTSLLSSYIKFGCVSIREVYWKVKTILGTKNDLLSQLFWREFYTYIAFYFPRVLKGKNYNQRYDKLKWKSNSAKFKKWCEGKTGVPVVDAGIREMNKTGYMHNRARLIVSNFMNRMLGMNWRLGEKYFATKLTDYDPAINNGNWQWIASTGVDPKPYFQRLFNPWLQSKKFDPDAEYIKKWVPELKDVDASDIHKWDIACEYYDLKELGYVKPIIDYKEARKDSVKMYRAV